MIQGPELAEIEKEKESLKNELMDCIEKILKFPDKEKQWKKVMALVVESEKKLKGKYDEMERKLHDKEKEVEDRITSPLAQSSEQTIVQDMSHVRLKYLELTGLKNQNKTLENLALQREQEKKTWEAKSQAWAAKIQEL